MSIQIPFYSRPCLSKTSKGKSRILQTQLIPTQINSYTPNSNEKGKKKKPERQEHRDVQSRSGNPTHPDPITS